MVAYLHTERLGGSFIFLGGVAYMHRLSTSYATETGGVQLSGSLFTSMVIVADNVKADGTSLIYIDRHLVHEAPACASSARMCGSSVARGDKPSGIRGSQAQQQRGQPSRLH